MQVQLDQRRKRNTTSRIVPQSRHPTSGPPGPWGSSACTGRAVGGRPLAASSARSFSTLFMRQVSTARSKTWKNSLNTNNMSIVMSRQQFKSYRRSCSPCPSSDRASRAEIFWRWVHRRRCHLPIDTESSRRIYLLHPANKEGGSSRFMFYQRGWLTLTYRCDCCHAVARSPMRLVRSREIRNGYILLDITGYLCPIRCKINRIRRGMNTQPAVTQ